MQLGVDLIIVEERAARVVILDTIDILRAQQLQEISDLAELLLVVDQDPLDVGGDEIARRLIDQVHVFVKQRRRLRPFVSFEDAVPHSYQHAQVGDQFRLADARGCGPNDGRHPLRANSLHHALETIALVGRFDLARNAGVLSSRHQDQIATGQRDVRRDPRALEAARLLDDLHEDVVASFDLLTDCEAAVALSDFDVADVQRLLVDVVDVQKSVSSEPDVDERRPHAGQHVLHFTFIDRADDLLFALNVELC